MRLVRGQRMAMVTMAVLVLWTLPTTMSTLGNNVWTVKVVERMVRNDRTLVKLPPAPLGHPREALWQGRWALARGDVDTAVAWLRPQAEATPDDRLITCALGEALLAQGGIVQGVAWLKRAGAFVQLRSVGWDALQVQRWNNALSALSAAYELRPLDPLVVSGLAYALHTARHDTDGAIELLRRAIGSSSDAASIVRWRLDLGRV